MTPDHDEPEADEYREDPDAAPTVDGRLAQMQGELRKLLLSSAAATLLIGGAVGVVDAWRATGFVNLCGFLVGAAMATLNLWLIARGWFQVIRGSRMGAQALLAFLGSFAAIVIIGAWVVFTHRAWTLGFAVGLTTPAVAGLLYARTLR